VNDGVNPSSIEEHGSDKSDTASTGTTGGSQHDTSGATTGSGSTGLNDPADKDQPAEGGRDEVEVGGEDAFEPGPRH
jgi:hypothetical protein